MGRGISESNIYQKIHRTTLQRLLLVASKLYEYNVDILTSDRRDVISLISQILNITERSAWDYYYTLVLLKRYV